MKIVNHDDYDDNSDNWIVTYSDMVTLLLAFFILLFSFSTIDAAMWREIVKSFTGELSLIESNSESSILEGSTGILDEVNPSVIEESSSHINEPYDVNNALDDGNARLEFNDLYQALTEYNEKSGLSLEITSSDAEIRIRLSNNLLFSSGKADINQYGLQTLEEIMLIIQEYNSIVDKLVLEGNTDNLPIHNEEFRDNFELSLKRALNVLYFFKYDCGFDAQKLIAMGYGEFNPVADNNTVEGRAANRRTDIVIVKKSTED